MKITALKLIFFLILFCIFMFSPWGGYRGAAQTNVYHPFPDSNAVWIVEMITNDPPGSSFTRHEILGDTIINSLIYKNISGDVWYYYECFPTLTEYAGAFRNDVINKKVIAVLDDGCNHDTLLYDFNLNINDTVNEYLRCPYFNLFPTIWLIDSILINNDYRKRYWAGGGPYGNSFIIEGIGTSLGPFHCVAFDPDHEHRLVCYKQNNQILYSYYPDTSQCFLLITGFGDNNLHTIQSEYVKIYSDNNNLIIRIPGYFEKNVRIKIYDIASKLIKQIICNGEGEIHIKKNEFKRGFYLLRITDTKYSIVVKFNLI